MFDSAGCGKILNRHLTVVSVFHFLVHFSPVVLVTKFYHLIKDHFSMSTRSMPKVFLAIKSAISFPGTLQ